MSSLSVATSSALSSLRTIQVQLAVASANIANADTDGYTRKTADQTSTVSAGVGTGVTVTAISSSVDKNLIRSIVEATSADGHASVTEDFLDKLADLLGTLSSGSDSSGDTLATSLSDLESALDQLATTPESSSLASQVVSDFEQIAGDLQDLSDSVQDLRTSADQQIESTVSEVNDALTRIDELNDDIVKAQARGQSTADLEDQRNSALLTVAAALDVNYYVDSSGRMTVYTTSGQPLVNSAGAHLLSYEPAANVNSATTFGGLTVNGKDITSGINSGSLAALVEARDEILPAVQDELDTLALALKSAINAAANEGTAVPAANSLAATLTSTASDTLGGTGTLRIAVTDSEGTAVSVTDLDLGSYTSVSALVSALDGISGLSASLDSAGHLVVTADSSSNGIALADVSSSIGGQGFSAYFGLNDILAGDGAETLAIRESLRDNASLLPVGVLDDSATAPATGTTVISTDAGSLASSLADALRDAGFPASGNLSAKTSSFADYAGEIVSDVAVKMSSAESAADSAETSLSTLKDAYSSSYGVNTDEETARITELENAYAASSQVLNAVQSMFDALLEAVK